MALISDFPIESSHIDIVINTQQFDIKMVLDWLWRENKFSATVLNRVKVGSEHRKIKFCVMIFEVEKTIVEIFENFGKSDLDVNGFFIVVFTNQTVKVNDTLILDAFWKKSLYNVDVLTESFNDSVALLTFFPFKDNQCRVAESTEINRFINQSWTHQEFFPEKLNNFHKCPIKIGTPPALLSYFQVEHDDGSLDYVGSDVVILKLLADKMNFRILLNYSSIPNDWGIVFENGSANGVLDQIVSGDSDMVVGFFLDSERSKILEQSCAYFFHPLVVIIPSGAPFTSLENLFRSFSYFVWLSMTITIIGAFFCIFYFKNGSTTVQNLVFENDRHNSYYNLLMIIVGGSINTLPKQNFPRMLIMTFILFCIVMRTVYQSQMFNYLQAGDNKKMVKTLEDMDERGFDFHILVSPGDSFHEDLKYPEK